MRARLAILGLGLLCAATLPAASGRADDDAGVRSVFARGAGERALALGGAYGAAGGDPTSLYWNPAGLARVSRVTLATAHTDLIGMGFQEQFGVLALPSWRLGTFALSVRRFGVDGVEHRDDRGTLLGDDLKDSQSELALGYARGFGEAWQVGASVKMQRQDLAGETGGGFGLDAGIIARPALALGATSALAHGLSLGLTFRNLIEPTIRLVSDDVLDPSAVRTGVALAMPLGSQVAALATADVEKTKDMDARLHAGMELALFDVLALRGGTNDGMVTAGLGVAWRDLEINYALEDNPIEPVHRFGIGLAFGPTVDQRRQAALDRQEAELNQRLTKAFAAEEQRRVDATVGAARAALADGDFAAALEGARTLAVIAPDDPAVARIEAAARYGQGRAAEDAGDLTGAAVAYQACLRADPGHAEAHDHLARVSAEGERLASRNGKLKTLYDGAMVAFAAGELERARDLLAEALDLAPADVGLRELAGHVDDALQIRAQAAAAEAAVQDAVDRVETAAADPTPRVDDATGRPGAAAPAAEVVTYASLPEARRRELADLYRQGVAAAEAGRREEAVGYWEIVWSAAPDYQQVTDHLVREYQARGMEAFAQGRLDRAIVVWERALEIDPGDARTKGYLTRAYEHRARIREIREGGR